MQFWKKGLAFVGPFFVFIAGFFLLFSAVIWAETPSSLPQLLDRAKRQSLSSDKTWMQLGHYKKGFLGKIESQVTSQNFFLAPNGRTDPEAELIATIEAYFEPTIATGDAHPQCRYPARYMWLKSALNWDDFVDETPSCSAYETWTSITSVDTVDLIFVSGYFGNPASFFGHLILKFHEASAVSGNRLLDQSVNFGAIVPPKENSFRYLYKGLTGGYDSTFSDQHYFYINHLYSEKDLRDQWVYRLNLSLDDKRFLRAHLWEVMGYSFDYYFLNRNCAYFIADAMQLAIDSPLINEGLPWAFPSSVFHFLEAASQKQSPPLVSEIIYVPSRQSRFYAKYSGLSARLQSVLSDMIAADFSLAVPAYLVLDLADKIAVLDTLIDYSYYLTYKVKDGGAKARNRRLLLARLQLKSPSKVSEIVPLPAPHLGQAPTKLGFGIGHNPAFGNYVRYQFRGAYYDHLSPLAGRPPHSLLEMADVQLRQYADAVVLDRLTLVHVAKLGLSPTGLPQDRSKTWRIKFGFERRDFTQKAADTLALHGGYGLAHRFSDGVLGSLMLDGRAVLNDGADSTAQLRSQIIFSAGDWMRGEGVLALGFDRPYYQLGFRLGDAKPVDYRFTIRHHIIEEYEAAISVYF